MALDKFFTEANLTALRELALRYVAERVDAQLEGIMNDRGMTEAWPVRERLLLVVDHHPSSRVVARRAASLASSLRAPLVAIGAESEDGDNGPRDRVQDQRDNLAFAEELGATIVRPDERGVVERIATVARERRATQVVLSSDLGSSRPSLLRRSLANELARELPAVELHMIAAGERGATEGSR
jgi:two-component system sensor histidine kinase KdpD